MGTESKYIPWMMIIVVVVTVGLLTACENKTTPSAVEWLSHSKVTVKTPEPVTNSKAQNGVNNIWNQ